MRIEDLTPGKMRECVDHYTVERVDDGAMGYTNETTLVNENLRVAWDESPPVNKVTGEVLSQRTTVQMGVRKTVNIGPRDLIVHDGEVYRVIGARKNLSRHWQIVQLELRDERAIPQSAS